MVVYLDEVTKQLINRRIDLFKNGRNAFDSYYKSQAVFDLVNRAVELKRNGDLFSANYLYSQAAKEEGFDSGVIWGWVKILLLAKNFSDAQLLLRYEHAMLVRWYQLDEYHPNNTLEFYKESHGVPVSISTHESTGVTPPINYSVADTFSFYDLLSTFTFRPFSYFTAKATINPWLKDEVEGKIAAFGGSSLWSNYFLSDSEFDDFLQSFGRDA